MPILSFSFSGGIMNDTVLLCSSLTFSTVLLLLLFVGQVDYMHVY